jgi:hypothetical protein
MEDLQNSRRPTEQGRLVVLPLSHPLKQISNSGAEGVLVRVRLGQYHNVDVSSPTR